MAKPDMYDIIDAFAETYAAEINAIRQVIRKSPVVTDPTTFPIGTIVLADVPDLPRGRIYEIIRQTHKGKRVFGRFFGDTDTKGVHLPAAWSARTGYQAVDAATARKATKLGNLKDAALRAAGFNP